TAFETAEDINITSEQPSHPPQMPSMMSKQPPYHNAMNSIFSPSTPFSASYPEPGVMFNDYSLYGATNARSSSNPCQSETRELGPLSMNGYSHMGPGDRCTSSPNAQSDGNNELSDDDDFDEEEANDQDETEQDPSQIKLKWRSYQEAREYRTTINKRFNPDPSIPQTDEDRQNIVRGFISAMKYTEEDSEDQNSTRPFKASKYKDDVLEMCAWNLLEMTIQRHTTGPLRTAWHDKSKGSKPYTTFMERIEAITSAMMRVETNKSLNRKKAYVMSAGKQYLQQQLKPSGNSTPEDTNNKPSSSRTKQRTISLSDTTQTSQPHQRRPSALGSPFSTPHHPPPKRENIFSGMGMPIRNPHPSSFDSSPNNIYSSSLPDAMMFSPDQHSTTPGSSIPRSYMNFGNEMYTGTPMHMPMSDHSTPLSSNPGLQTPVSQMRGMGMRYGVPPSAGSTVSPSSLMLAGGNGPSRQQFANAPAQYNHPNVSTPPQLSPRKRGFDVSSTGDGVEHPSQRRAM
ncbi:hypothetical protein KEM56_007464, partial [Ascosphaera pollenicola]